MPAAAGPGGLRQLVHSIGSEYFVAVGDDGRLRPRLASGWRSEGNLVWYLAVPPTVIQHDGTTLDSEEMAEALRRAAEDRTRTMAFALSEILETRSASRTEVLVRLRRPMALFLSDLVDVPVPGSKTSAGPFRVVRQGPDRAVLRAHDHYYRGRPGIEEIELVRYETLRRAWSALLRGEIDFLYEVSPEARQFVEPVSDLSVFSFPRPYAYAILFNVERGPLRDVRVRRAMNWAVDRALIIDKVLRGSGEPATSPVSPRYWASDRSAPIFKQDLRVARELLGRAAEKLAEERNPVVASFACLVPIELQPFESLALLVQRQLLEVGIDMRVEPVTLTEQFRRLSTGDFDAVLLEMLGGFWPQGFYAWFHSPAPGTTPLARTGYRAADAALDRLRYAPTDEEVRRAVADFQRIIYEDPPALFLAWSQRARAVSRRFEVPVEPGRDIMATLWAWRPAVREEERR
ncbi:MAG TPA: ABC transporter substrate-binding protein [Vicinamibacterales bacterium]|nr:ABC transporter substrate-binding protein [Vicinamibacterales bacterium]